MGEQAADGPEREHLTLYEAADRALKETIKRRKAEYEARQAEAGRDAVDRETPQEEIAREIAERLVEQARRRADEP
jgi:hypothetical protein